MRTPICFTLLTLVWSLGLATRAEAQATPVTQTAAKAAEERAAYDPAGRRDPFTSLALSGTALTPTSNRPVGVRGLLISELSLRGVVQSRQRLLATVEGPDKRTYTISNGDQLLDGTVKVITADAVVFLQQVTDPLSPIKQREIRKTLRPTEENR
jgi:Tfp pilus assembly protein PilP